MKFTDLTKEEQEKEIDDYIQGWKETHPEETLSREVAKQCCIDTEDEYSFMCENCNHENEWDVQKGDHCDNCGKELEEY